MSAATRVAVLNCGSSSIKFALFDADGGVAGLARRPRWGGRVEGIGGPAPRLLLSDAEPRALALDPAAPYHAALETLRDAMRERLGADRLLAVAHRVVHGGAHHAAPLRLDAALLAELRALIPLAPLHQPFALEAIEVLLRERPTLPQIACFDTAFHHTLPLEEQLLPLPWSAYERGLRRYGFHGLSYEYQATVLPERHGDRARGRVLVAHLGSGASLCAMRGLRSVATTMGFSALDGLMMGTRCGALDPGALLYLMEQEGLSPHDVGQMLYHEAGLLGVSGTSAEPRVLLPREAGDARAAAALALYVRRIVREAGALVAVLGGLDLLVFTAGIGEHQPEIRSRVCAGLAFLGLRLDEAANARHEPLISAPGSAVRVAVEPANEEWVAARHALALLQPHAGPAEG
ncbi:acetate/propionate family kinase [Pelomonas sp. CA6]|uniref:acetate/propionate family kinase n=1 Tax=Pelomonas sp. CA6 TaxID=2907999 RepID=UPI001F4BD381|nr:acetate/propionate family kinase [Pelomonas sp. CA6]MCH7343789.1 acetate/propionate family kinase [Pelomonas sp. CA6]